MYMAASNSEVVEDLGSSIPFYIEPILIELYRGHHIVPILPISMAELHPGRRSAGGGAPRSGGASSNSNGSGVSDSNDDGGSGVGSGNGDGKIIKVTPKVGTAVGPARV